MSMHHQNALATKASERYLLGEMNEPERFDFEAHYFDCPACAEEVRTGVAMARGIKAVCAEDAALRPHVGVVREVPRRGWLSWLSPASLVPSTAALAFGLSGCMAGLRPDSFPTLGESSASALTDGIARRGARRGAGAVYPPQDPGLGALPGCQRRSCRRPSILMNLVAPGGAVSHRDATRAPHAGTPLIVFLPNSAIRESGTWELLLRNQRELKSPVILSPFNSIEEIDG